MSHDLERGERAVPLVEVKDARRDAQRRERADSANAKEQLLANAHALVATVQACGQLPILRLVAVDVRIEQEERGPADGHPPDPGGECPGAGLDRHHDGHAVGERGLHRQQPVIDVEVVLVLPAVPVQPLPEVPLVVVQPDPDQRDPEIGGALDVIAGEDPQAARVNRQRLVQAEFGGEVRHRPRPQDARVPRAPSVLRVEVLLHPAMRVADAAVQGE